MAAVVKPKKGPINGRFYTEEDWNDEAKADAESGYFLSKVSLSLQNSPYAHAGCMGRRWHARLTAAVCYQPNHGIHI